MSDGFLITETKLKMDEGFKRNLTLQQIFNNEDEIDWCRKYLYLKDRYYKTGKISFEDLGIDKKYFKRQMKYIYKYVDTDDIINNCDFSDYNKELIWMAHLKYSTKDGKLHCKDKKLYEYDLKRQDYFEKLTYGFWEKIDKWHCIRNTSQKLRDAIEYYFFEKWYDFDVIEKKLLSNDGRNINFTYEYDKRYTTTSRYIISDEDRKRYKVNFEALIHNAMSEFKRYITKYKEEDFPIILSSKYIDEKINEVLKGKENYNKEEEYSNKRFNSKEEEILYEKLCKKFGKDNILKEYKSKEYPWHCDFYIKDKNLFLEYQGTWSHFGSAWKGTLGQKVKLSEMLKKLTEKNRTRYTAAIKNWTVMDSAKRKWANDHKLNWFEFFNMKDMNKWIENYA